LGRWIGNRFHGDRPAEFVIDNCFHTPGVLMLNVMVVRGDRILPASSATILPISSSVLSVTFGSKCDYLSGFAPLRE
jgi:hypothetical protein